MRLLVTDLRNGLLLSPPNRIRHSEQSAPSQVPVTSMAAKLDQERFVMSKRIPLTQGKVATVDDADFDWLNRHKWCHRSTPYSSYAVREIRQDSKAKQLGMHRAIMRPPVGMEVDHRNGDGLDNRKSNLRICTHKQNIRNSRKRAKASSRYKGVSWHKHSRAWRAYIKTRGKQFHIGLFDNEQDAAHAYNVAAHKLFGQFAHLNLIEKGANNGLP